MEKNIKKNVYIYTYIYTHTHTHTHTYMCNQVTLLYSRNEHIVNQLYFNKKKKKKTETVEEAIALGKVTVVS